MPLSRTDRNQLVALVLLGAFVLLLIAARYGWVGRGMGFLLWNLFLAAVPVGAAWLSRRLATTASGSRLALAGLVACTLAWLGFLPNAPYIATDLMHLRNSRPAFLWLDTLVLGTAALAGMLAGLLSLRWMHEVVLARVRVAWLGWAFVVAVSLVAAFGVYLGRFQRWNTWDILTRPGELLADAWSTLGEVKVFAFVGLFGLGLAIGYGVLTLLVGPVPTPTARAERMAAPLTPSP